MMYLLNTALLRESEPVIFGKQTNAWCVKIQRPDRALNIHKIKRGLNDITAKEKARAR